MRFTFIHAADLHLGSPLAALGLRDAEVGARFAAAGRAAVKALVDEAINSQAAFLIIAGDVFDGDWRDVATGLFMVSQLSRLSREGIPVYLVKGNHDADSVVSYNLAWPSGTSVFGFRKAETFLLESHNVALHGRSYKDREPEAGFAASYPAHKPGWLNIGILHTALDGARGDHVAYAPCTIPQLQGFGYDYWALGHIHQPQIVSQDPWMVYPGNIQGRSVRETGARGAMRVSVEDGRIASVVPIVLDAARWAHERVDVSGCADEGELIRAVEAAMAAVHRAAEARPVAVRLTLHGTHPLHARLTARHEEYHADLRQRGTHLAEDFWLEKLVLETRSPAVRTALAEADGLDVAALLDASLLEPEMAKAAGENIAALAGKLPREMKDEWLKDETLPARILAQARDLLAARLETEGAGAP